MSLKLLEDKWGYGRTYCDKKLFEVHKRNSSVKEK